MRKEHIFPSIRNDFIMGGRGGGKDWSRKCNFKSLTFFRALLVVICLETPMWMSFMSFFLLPFDNLWVLHQILYNRAVRVEDDYSACMHLEWRRKWEKDMENIQTLYRQSVKCPNGIWNHYIKGINADHYSNMISLTFRGKKTKQPGIPLKHIKLVQIVAWLTSFMYLVCAYYQ